MKKTLANVLAASLVLAVGSPSLAAEKMMSKKCAKSDPMVMVDTKTKMYHGLKDGKSHKVMLASGDKTMMVCKSKADAMGAKMMMNGKAM